MENYTSFLLKIREFLTMEIKNTSANALQQLVKTIGYFYLAAKIIDLIPFIIQTIQP